MPTTVHFSSAGTDQFSSVADTGDMTALRNACGVGGREALAEVWVRGVAVHR